MANGFTTEPQTKNDVRRNVWDWTHSNNLTTEIGRLTPCFCRRVPAGTSLSIKSDFALKFMPMQFPIQTQLKARLNFFKMPIRALWKGYKDWISSVNMKASDGSDINSKHVPPFISISTIPTWDLYKNFSKYFGTGSDLDYMGLPTTYDGIPFEKDITGKHICITPYSDIISDGNSYDVHTCAFDTTATSHSFQMDASLIFGLNGSQNAVLPTPVALDTEIPVNSRITLNASFFPLGSYLQYERGTESDSYQIKLCYATKNGSEILNFVFHDIAILNYDMLHVNDIYDNLSVDNSTKTASFSVTFTVSKEPIPAGSYLYFVVSSSTDEGFYYLPTNNSASSPISYSIVSGGAEYTPETCPWFNMATNSGLRVSSLPLRMREAVYNAYIRNIKNNPLIVDGIPKYNDWVLGYEFDGNDTDNYSLHKIGTISGDDIQDYFYGRKYVNWEPDWLTTAVPEPQQGTAPLVGLTTYASVVSTDENGANTMKLNSVITDEDGNNYAVNYISDKEGLKNVTYTELSATDELGKPLSNMYQAVSNGISITDLRNVNAYMRYLELNMRRGYSYKDIIEGRYDVNVRYDELMMPEFLGGFTRNVAVAPITQTVQTSDTGSYEGALGSQSGDAFVAGQPDVDIDVYCDEDSIIMGFISVSPVPIYTQTLLSDWLIQDPLDIFSPEFANTGFQPIPLKQVAPIQTFNNGGLAKMDDVFGYQRPWYDLIAMTDQAHGLFRSSLRNFIMYRSWDDTPVLGKDFLLVKPEQVNNVFSVTETTDKIFGQIRFIIKCKNEVSRSIVPRLE
ncbi:major capsid protein [Dipodfec virus UOA04_Rod_391]|nr:major capsid protein [Dipodfec virus UOA04_Rod_391]